MPGVPAIFGEGRLAATGESWRLRRGALEDLDQAFMLQAHVNGNLPPKDRYFIVPKTRAQLAAYLAHQEDAYLPLLEVNDQPAGQLILRFQLKDFELARHAQAFEDCRQVLPDGYALVQGALVDPVWRGRRLLRVMLNGVEAGLGQPVPPLLARIVPANLPSWISFMEAGYRIAAAARDPDDERQVFYLYKDGAMPLSNETTRAAPDFATCYALLAEGWQGTGYDRETRQIVFTR